MDVYLATGNAHKLEEFKTILRGRRVSIHSPDELGGMPEVEENGETFEANARLKALALLEKIPAGKWVIADDSGLQVDFLKGAPGVHSARFAGPEAMAVANNLKLLHEMLDVPPGERTARFQCVLVFAQKGGPTHIFEGTCEGSILMHPRGNEGFGYDPLFQPKGLNKSFAELGGEEKNRLSHRGRAIRQWIAFLDDSD